MSSVEERIQLLETIFQKQDNILQNLSEDPVTWTEQVRILKGEPLSKTSELKISLD